MKKTKLAVIVGNRDFFPDELVTEARQDILAVFNEMDIEPVMLAEEDTNLGGVETWEDANKCAALFKANADEIDGILVVLPNFGDEKGVADTVSLSGLQVPILIQAYPDDLDQFNIERRRDSFCGKVSVCNNLRQYGYPFSLTELHTVSLTTDSFKADLRQFVGVCRVVNGLKNARLGAIGTRPNAFITIRYSEKLLQAYGIHVTVPRLGWQMQSDRRGARQTAYRILVAGDPQRLREGQADLWDSELKKESHFTLDGQAVSGSVHEVEAGEYHFVVS